MLAIASAHHFTLEFFKTALTRFWFTCFNENFETSKVLAGFVK
jgi:hypothetical protein